MIYSFDKKIKVFFIVDWMQFKLNIWWIFVIFIIYKTVKNTKKEIKFIINVEIHTIYLMEKGILILFKFLIF